MHRFYKVTGVSAKSCRGYQRTAGEGSCWGKAPKNTGDGQRYYRKLPGSRKCQELQGIPENCRGGELLGESTKKHWGWPEVLPEVAGEQEVPRVAGNTGELPGRGATGGKHQKTLGMARGITRSCREAGSAKSCSGTGGKLSGKVVGKKKCKRLGTKKYAQCTSKRDNGA